MLLTENIKMNQMSAQHLVTHMVAFLISEMRFPEHQIVEYAECNEQFPSSFLEKVKFCDCIKI